MTAQYDTGQKEVNMKSMERINIGRFVGHAFEVNLPNDWEEIEMIEESDISLSWGGIQVFNDGWYYSPSKKWLRETGHNSQGKKWDRIYIGNEEE